MTSLDYRLPQGNRRSEAPILALGVVLVVASVGLCAVAPPLGFALIFTWLSTLVRKHWLHMVLITLAALCVFVPLNITKVPFNDWSWYSLHYLWLKHMPFSSYIGTRFGEFNIKLTEPVYYFISSTLSKLSGGRVWVLASFVTIFVYSAVGALIGVFSKAWSETPVRRAILEWAIFLCGVTFTLTLHLVRQQVAGAFMIFGLVAFLHHRVALALLLGVVAVFTHNSAAMPIALFAFLCLADRTLRGRHMTLLAVGGGIGLGVVTVVLAVLTHYYSNGRSDGEVSTLVVVVDMFLFGGFLATSKRMVGLEPQHLRALRLMALGYFLFVLTLMPLPIPFLRMYFFIEYLRVIFIAGWLSSYVSRNSYVFYAPFILVLALSAFALRVERSPFTFGTGVARELARPTWAPLGGR